MANQAIYSVLKFRTESTKQTYSIDPIDQQIFGPDRGPTYYSRYRAAVGESNFVTSDSSLFLGESAFVLELLGLSLGDGLLPFVNLHLQDQACRSEGAMIMIGRD